jgi:ribonuclease BN (tRNA processing enzyme)
MIILDAGSGIRLLAETLPEDIKRIDLLVTHLHLDHILGLGFFPPIHNANVEINIWGPCSPLYDLNTRLKRYLAPPYFPLHMYELPCRLVLHEVPSGDFEIGPFHISTALVCHPGPTVGYRITAPNKSVVTYLPDHEPALGVQKFPISAEWTSGYELAHEADVLIHDLQYFEHEYQARTGWGHSSTQHTLSFAQLAEVKQLMPFHYDPSHSDDTLDQMFDDMHSQSMPFEIVPAREGLVVELS